MRDLHQQLSLAWPGEALVSQSGTTSYARLEGATERVRLALKERGVGPGNLVALLLDRDPAGLAGLLGTLGTGACYLPLDTHAPSPRLLSLLERAEPTVILCHGHGLRRIRGLLRRGARLPTCLELTDDGAPAQVHPGDVEPGALVRPSSAYIMFTSGSTGEPKGVEVSREAVARLLAWAGERFEPGPRDRVLGLAPLYFDISVVELLLPLTCGARACLAPPLAGASPGTLAGFMEREEVTFCYLVSSVARQLVDALDLDGRYLDRLEHVILSGEAPQTAWVDRAMERMPGARLYNLYGSTEVPVCALFQIPRPPAGEIPLGREVGGAEVLLVTGQGREAGDGQEGEIWASGPIMLTGHFRDPGLDASRFVQRAGRRYLRTGDWARRDPSGRLIFAGRRDQQIKVRGMRVDLTEVEAVVARCPGVAEVAALALAHPEHGHQVRAAVSPLEVSADQVLDHCRQNLPGYMIPERVVSVAALPRTASGKVDRKQAASLVSSTP